MHSQLMRKLSKPSKVASILDWKKTFHHTVLAVNVHKNRVGIAIASHPSLGIPCLELEPLRFENTDNSNHLVGGDGTNTNTNTNSNRKKKTIAGAIDRECLERFVEIIDEYKVCGVVVNWPLQRDTGRMGAACGRVIFALEQLLERSNETKMDASTIHGLKDNNNKKNHEQRSLLSRPFCLWDAGHINLADPSKKVDAFGRCASYGKENPILSSNEPALSATSTSNGDQYYTTKQKYFASKEQYHEDELTVVLGVWDDFCREHWPDLCAAKNNNNVKDKVEEGDDDENENTDRLTSTTTTNLYSSDFGPPVVGGTPLRQQEVAKNKKSLIATR